MTPPGLSVCPQCNEPKLPHHACLSCGYYKGQEVLKPKEETRDPGDLLQRIKDDLDPEQDWGQSWLGAFK